MQINYSSTLNTSGLIEERLTRRVRFRNDMRIKLRRYGEVNRAKLSKTRFVSARLVHTCMYS